MTRRRINQIFDPVLSVDIAATKVRRLVYLLVASRPLRYGRGYSRIIYIGTTGHGVRRIASSASKHIVGAGEQLKGLRRLDAYVVWARSRKGPPTRHGMNFWNIPERALLIRFRERYGEPPLLNRAGRRMRPKKHEFETFRLDTIDRVINRYT